MSFNKKIFELDKRPYLSFERVTIKYSQPNNLDSSDRKNAFQIGIELRNFSKVHLKYDVVRFVVSLENKTLHEPNFLNRGGYLYPNQSSTFDYPVIDDIELKDENSVLNGKLEYEIEYYFERSKKYKTKRKMQIIIILSKLYCAWKFEYQEEQ